MIQENASLAFWDMIYLMEIVSSHLLICKVQLIKDAENGKVEFALNVQKDLLSMLIKVVFKFLIFAKHHKVFNAQAAIKDIF